jgi:hypothetical protein
LGDNFFRPEEHLTKDKIKKFEKIVEFYLEEKKLKKIKNSFGVEEKLRYHL